MVTVSSFLNAITNVFSRNNDNGEDSTALVRGSGCASDLFLGQLLSFASFKFASNDVLTQTFKNSTDANVACVNDVSGFSFGGIIRHVPTTLLPLVYPLQHYTRIKKLSPFFVEILDLFSCDYQLINEVYAAHLNNDSIIKHMIDIMNQVYGSGGRDLSRDIRGYIARTDYLLHSNEQTSEYCDECNSNVCFCKDVNVVSPKMVEVNTTSVSLAHLSKQTAQAHGSIIDKAAKWLLADVAARDEVVSDYKKASGINEPILGVVNVLLEAHEAYSNRYVTAFGKEMLSIFYLTTETLKNFFDNAAVFNGLQDAGVDVIVLPTKDLCALFQQGRLFIAKDIVETKKGGSYAYKMSKTTVDPKSFKPGKLILDLGDSSYGSGNHLREISTIYFRSLYNEENILVHESVWDVWKLLEFSDAVKFPNIALHLAGSKLAQMYWSNIANANKLVHRYLTERTSKSDLSLLQHKNALYEFSKEVESLAVLQVDPSDEKNRNIVEDAIKNPNKYVLKSQAEGGFGVFFSDQLVLKLKHALENGLEHVSNLVLMAKIATPWQRAVFLKIEPGQGTVGALVTDSVTEVGVYTTALYDGASNVTLENHGYLARTKPSTTTGGGVCSGHSYMSSLCFV